ncbi:hypothetical protein ONZ45_g10668 [Pleurotus djamor]|nr:hypothetical protein ONZ45_g10668 [Pleurotus djamor]
MCTRFALHLSHEQVRRGPTHVHLPVTPEWINQNVFTPKYNIAPTNFAPVVTQTHKNASEGHSESGHSMRTMQWGLVLEDNTEENKEKMKAPRSPVMNVNAKRLLIGRGWPRIKQTQRCVILCHGYYVWLNRENTKIPYFGKHQSDELILLAGLYNVTAVEDSPNLWTFAVVTTEANKAFTWLQDIQPVVLSTQRDVDTWLGVSKCWRPYSSLASIIRRYHRLNLPLQCYRVSKGNVKKESRTFILPVENRKDGIAFALKNQEEVTAIASQTQRWDSNRLSLRAVPPSQPPAVITIGDDDDDIKPEEEPAEFVVGSSQDASQRKDEKADAQSASSNNPVQSKPKRLPKPKKASSLYSSPKS